MSFRIDRERVRERKRKRENERGGERERGERVLQWGTRL